MFLYVVTEILGRIFIATGDQLADALTKQLPGPAFIEFRNKILKSNKGRRAT
jgi:hypothetical protein